MELISDFVKIKDLLEWKRGNILRINPEYQRGAVWNDTPCTGADMQQRQCGFGVSVPLKTRL